MSTGSVASHTCSIQAINLLPILMGGFHSLYFSPAQNELAFFLMGGFHGLYFSLAQNELACVSCIKHAPDFFKRKAAIHCTFRSVLQYTCNTKYRNIPTKDFKSVHNIYPLSSFPANKHRNFANLFKTYCGSLTWFQKAWSTKPVFLFIPFLSERSWTFCIKPIWENKKTGEWEGWTDGQTDRQTETMFHFTVAQL